MIEQLASWSFAHRRRVLIGWVVAVIVLTVAGSALSHPFADSARLKGTDSDRAYQLLGREFPNAGGASANVVFESRDGFRAPAERAAIARYLRQARHLSGVAAVSSPLDDPSRVSKDGTIAYATIDLARADGDRLFDKSSSTLLERAGPLRQAGVRTEFSGGWFNTEKSAPTEGIGIVAAVLILLISFGSVVAMGLPIITALFGVGAGLAGVSLWTIFVPTPNFTPTIAAMIGIGVGIDYALFIITRYRTELAHQPPEVALRTAMGSAGRAVVFAGCTVVISLLGMLLTGLDFIRGLAFGSASAVLTAVLAAVTLLPAMLSFATKRLTRAAVRHERRTQGRETMWHRWGRFVQRRPWPVALGGLAILLVLSAPLIGIRLASADAGNDAKGTTTRQSYDLMAKGFGPGVNGPLVVAVDGHGPLAKARLDGLRDRLTRTADVAHVGPVQLSRSGRAAVLTVVPASSPQSTDTEHLVHRLRSDVIPASGLTAHVGGSTASDVDFSEVMAGRLPVFIGAVLALSFLLLAAVFRSVLVPLKAVLMNLLSIGAAYGLMVAVFQWGWFGSVFGVTGAPIAAWIPMMMFAIVFGLSMDYEVFLLSSIKERYVATGDNGTAVVEGLSATARVITAAAAIMVFVFGGFLFDSIREVKVIGFGLATAVLLDATLVRMVLVPATMELLGDRNWWLPRAIDRLLPQLHVERPEPTPAPAAARVRTPEPAGR